MKFKHLSVLLLLLFSSIVLLGPTVPLAHATGPTVSGTQASANPASPNECVTGLLSANNGDVLALTVSGEFNSAGQNYSGAPTDLVGTTGGWKRIAFVSVTTTSGSALPGTFTAWAGAWVANSTSTGNHEAAVLYTTTNSNTHFHNWCGLIAMSGLPTFAFSSRTFTCSTSCTPTISTPSLSYQSGSILVATGVQDSADDVDNFQLKTTVSPAFSGFSNMCLTSSTNNCMEYFITSASGSTTFPMVSTWIGSNPQAEVAIDFGVKPPTTLAGAITNLDCSNCVIGDNGKFYNFVLNLSSAAVQISPPGNLTFAYLEFNDSVNNYIVQYNFVNNSATLFKAGAGGISLGSPSVKTAFHHGPPTSFELANVTIPIQFNNAAVNSQLRSIYIEACIKPAVGPGVCTSFNRVQTNYFSILVNGGGLANYKQLGTCSRVAGGDVFSDKCSFNASPRSSIQTNDTWVYLQSYSTQFAIIATGTPFTSQKQLITNFGFYYWDGSTWVLGPNVKISELNGKNNSQNAWVNYNTAYYFGHTLISNSTISMYLEATHPQQTRFYADIWYSNHNASTTWGMRVNAYYVGMTESCFITCFFGGTWNPIFTNQSTSSSFGSLFDHSNNLISATQITCTKVYWNMTYFKNTGGTLSSNYFVVNQFNLASQPHQMQGVVTPVYTQPLVPIISTTSNFLAPIYYIISSIATFFVKALVNLGTILFTNILQKIPGFGPFLSQATGLFVQFFSLFGIVVGYLISLLSFLYSTIGQITAPISIITQSWATISGIYTHIFGGVNFGQIIELFVIIVFGISLLEAVVTGDVNWILNFSRTTWHIVNAVIYWTYLLVKFLVDFIEGLIP